MMKTKDDLLKQMQVSTSLEKMTNTTIFKREMQRCFLKDDLSF